MLPQVCIGTSGWHYPGSGGWNGLFYPKPRPRGFDELVFYSSQFDTVEVNTTFYGQPRADVSQAWADKTPRAFQFAVKLFQQFTHPDLFRARVVRDLTKQLGAADLPDEAVSALIEANVADIDTFKRGIEPLAAAGKLGPLLAQFPASFKSGGQARVHLSALLRAFSGYAVAVELRHRSWSDDRQQTLDLLAAFGASWVWIDEPKFATSIRQDFGVASGPLAYVRLHGRNADTWWHHARPEDRYDYLYSLEELTPIAETLATAQSGGRSAYAFANNHKNAQAVTSAQQLKALVSQATSRSLNALVAPRP